MLGVDDRTELARRRPLPAREPTGFRSEIVPVFDRYVAHPGQRLTMGRVRQVFRNAECGDPEEQCDVFDDRIEADGHLRSALEVRVEAVARKQWIIAPGGDRPSDKRAAALLEEAIRDVPGWRETMAHQLTANWYGYAYSEIVWQRPGRLAVPVHFENVPPRRFRFREDNDQPLLRVSRNVLGEPLRPGKWWGTERRRRGKVAMGGLMRTAVYWAMFKSMTTRDWLVFANRYGLPYAWATYESNMRPEDKAALKSMMRSLGTDGWAVFQRGAEVTIAEAQKTGGSDEVHGAIVHLCNSEISKLIHGATLVSENQGIGSFAATREHGGVAFERKMGDAEWIGETFTDCVGKPFVHYNGLPGRPPVLKIHVVRDASPQERLKTFSMAANDLGIPVSMQQVRQEAQLKPPINDDDIAPGKTSAPAPIGDDPGDTEDPDRDVDE